MYSMKEVHAATSVAFKYKPSFIEKPTIDQDIPGAIDTLHVLVSDAAWGIGHTHLVDPAFKVKVRCFVRTLLASIEPIEALREAPSVVSFMVHHFFDMDGPEFVMMLRAYLLGFPDTRDLCGVDVGDGDNARYTALHLAARDERVPLVVLQTLLESGAEVDLASDDGDTALMLATENYISWAKMQLLLAYGADISVYNLCFHNAIHIAAHCANINGLRILLEARKERLQNRQLSSMEFSLRKTGKLDPDPLHLPDMKYRTPLRTVLGIRWMNYKERLDAVNMLVSAGASGDSDLNYEGRVADARAIRGPGASPKCFGILSTHSTEDIFTLFGLIRKEGYSVNMRISSDVIEQFIDVEHSVLPPVSMNKFSIENMLLCCVNKRFDFDAAVDGIDMDIHFNNTAPDGRHLDIMGCDSGAKFKLALRFPRGPFPMETWIQDGVYSEIIINQEYTMTHVASLEPCSTHMRQLLNTTRPLCNPLRTCAAGLTAVETLQRRFTGNVMSWYVKKIFIRMCADREDMLVYIHRDALLLLAGQTGDISQQVAGMRNRVTESARMRTSRRLYANPFDRLPDDVCKRILEFVVA
jgi:hypothetical protein